MVFKPVFNELFVSFYFSGTFITVVLLGPCTHAVSTLCHLLDILEKVWRIKNANKTRSVSYKNFLALQFCMLFKIISIVNIYCNKLHCVLVRNMQGNKKYFKLN